MLTFYKGTSDQFTDRVEQKLRDMVIAHKVIRIALNDSLPEEVNENKLPLLDDGHQTWSSPAEIEDFLEELHHEVRLGRSLQSDSCHLDPDDPEQCL
ncbi:hypothetical protein SAMN05443144_10553 [Fodinibius roseus]|uniref:Uncharacterized protein n=1 Tax=Fodinibius roseus TaxID=1194090 RepID=A0A1M4YG01_9BACT|nr:hypothetical protein [Fodinibius roseus]SHF04599.1 hypothetical protein SAMN05443144_10553 [Fodinibius roseus]